MRFTNREGNLSRVYYKINRSKYSLLSEAEKVKITDERIAAVNCYRGIRMGWSKAVYQNEDGVFIMHGFFSKDFNVFGV